MELRCGSRRSPGFLDSRLARFLAQFGTFSLIFAGHPSDASACSSVDFGPSQAWPPDGSTGVSPATNVFVLGDERTNDGVSLTAGGNPMPFTLEVVGALHGTAGTVYRFELGDMLEPSTEYVIAGPGNFGPPVSSDDAGAPVLLSRFTTAAAYDKAAGIAPLLNSLDLWSVRYPIDDVGSGNCVFSEYHGYASIAFERAVIPNTTPAGSLYTLTIAPRNGGATQSLLFPGDAPFEGRDVSVSPYPNSLPSEWFLELDPRREYCATLSAIGDGNMARLPVTSQSVCARVTEICAPGAECPSTSEEASSCSFSQTGRFDPAPQLPWFALGMLAVSLAFRRRASAASNVKRLGGGLGTPPAATTPLDGLSAINVPSLRSGAGR